MLGLTVPASKVYDGTTSAAVGGSATLQVSEVFASGTSLDGKPYTGQTVSLTGTPVGAYNSKDVGTAANVTFSGLSLTGSDAGNYTLTMQTPASATVTKKTLTMSGLSASAKVYDATTSAVVTGTPVLAASEAAGTGATSDGIPYTGDTVNITGTALGTYNSKDVLTAATVTFSGLTLGGTHAGNYTLTMQTPVAATITTKALTVTGLSSSASKVYDGTINAVVSGTPALLAPEAIGAGTTSDGKAYLGDAVTLSGTAFGTYNSKHVTLATTVTFGGMSLINTQASNYSLTSPTTPSTITAKPVTVTAITNVKVYDRTTAAAAIPSASGVVSGDTASFIETYSDKNYGLNNKTLTPSGIVTDGNGGTNYTYTFNSFSTGTITKYPVTVDAITNTKMYDGTTTAAATPNNSGVIVGDTASFIEAYSDKNIGSGNKTLIPSGIVSDGNSGLNYSYTFNNFTTGTITVKPVTVTAATNTKVYDGTTTAAAIPNHTGIGTGDTANFIEAYLDPNVGSSNKTLVPTGDVTDGNGGLNYSYTFNTISTGTITKADPTVTAFGGSFLFTGTSHAGSGTAVGVLLETLSPAVTLSYEGTGSTVYGPIATPPTNVGTYAVTASFAGNANYNAKDSAPADLTIDSKYIPTVTVDCGLNTVVYGNNLACTVTVTSPIDSTDTATGTVAWTTGGAGSFNATTPCTLSSTVSGIATCSAIYTPSAVGTGTHTLTAAYGGDVNFSNASGSKNVTVSKANASITWPTASAITYGQTLADSTLSGGSASPTGAFAFTTPSTAPNAGTASQSVTFTPVDPNYNITTGLISVTVAQASSTVTVTCPASATYTGLALTPCTASYSGAGGLSGSLTPTYLNNTIVGTATANASYAGDVNHTSSSDSKTFAILKASSTVTVICPVSVTYTGLPLTPCTASYSGVGGLSGTLTPTYSANTNVGTVTANAVYAGDANHNGSSDSANFDITQATPILSVTNPVVVYTGSAQAAIVTGSVAGTVSNVKYDGSSSAPTAIGVYTVTANFASGNTNYKDLTDGAAGTFEISAKLPQTITFGALAGKTIGAPDFSVTATASSSLAVDFSTLTTSVCTVTANGDTVHLVAIGTCTITAHQGGNGTYDAAPDVSQSFAVTNVPISLPSPWVGGVSISSDKNIVSVGRPHIGSEIASYDGFSAGAHTAYVPMLFKNAFGGSYDSALYIQNVDSALATISIAYYDSTGALTCTTPDTIAPLASKGYWLPGLPVSCLPDGWVGGAVITSDKNIVSNGRPHIGAEVMTYNSFSSGSLTSYLPMLFRGAFGGTYNAAFYVQNVGSSQAIVAIEYYDSAGDLTCSSVDTVAPLASKGYWLPSTCVPAGWVGGVVITSDQPIVTVGRPHVGTQITTYNGFSAGSGYSSLPMLFKNAYGGSYDAAFYVQNLNPSTTANLNIKYYDLAGTLTCTVTTETIAPLASNGYWLPGLSAACLPDGWIGGAVVTSNVDIVAIGRPHIGAQATTYNGFTAGSLSTSLPMLFKDAFGGSYDSAFYVQNTESTAATVITKFYDSTGALTCTRNDTLVPFSTLSLWLPSLTCVP
jgi:hypothetical protein